jgi:uncharacterized metal-binding protein YceD (DUF177 family)
VEKPSFVVRLADLERGTKEVTFTLSEGWLRHALSDAEAVPLGPGEANVELMKSGELVIVRGQAHAKITVPCVVTLDPVPLELRPDIFLQLAREHEPHRGRPGGKAEGKHGGGGGVGAPPTHAKKAPPTHAKKGGKNAPERAGKRGKDDPELSAEEAAYDSFKGEEIVLDDFFREFLLLEIPPYPRRSDLPSPEESISFRPLESPEAEAKPLDPRLAPLLGLADRLKGSAK